MFESDFIFLERFIDLLNASDKIFLQKPRERLVW